MSDNPTQQTPESRSFEERILAHFENFHGRLTALEDKVDSRLRETRPIWEAVLARLDAVEKRLDEIEKGVKKLNHTVLLIHEDNLHIRADQRDLRERVEKLESQSTR